MRAEKALQLQNAWGNKPCEHPNYDREILFGCATGDYICVQCGRCLSDVEIETIKTKRKKQH